MRHGEFQGVNEDVCQFFVPHDVTRSPGRQVACPPSTHDSFTDHCSSTETLVLVATLKTLKIPRRYKSEQGSKR